MTPKTGSKLRKKRTDRGRSVQKMPEIVSIARAKRHDGAPKAPQPPASQDDQKAAPSTGPNRSDPLFAKAKSPVGIDVLSPKELANVRRTETLNAAQEIVSMIQREILEELKLSPESPSMHFDLKTYPADAANMAINALTGAGWKVFSDGETGIWVELPAVEAIAEAPKQQLSKVRPLQGRV